jgi:YtkA-like
MTRRHSGTQSTVRPGWRLSVCALVAALFLLGACSRPKPATAGIVAESEVSPQPPRVGPALFTLRLKDRNGQPISGAHITLEADMAHPGMAPVLGETAAVGPGRYQGTLNLNMGGDWVVLAHIRLPDGQTLDREINVPGVQAN